MIVSFHRRFIFAAVPRTGSHTVRQVLRPYLGPHDWEQCLLFGARAFPVAPLARLRHGHLALTDVRPFLLADLWPAMLRFGFVRNPFDRFVSACALHYRDAGTFERDPKGTMKQILADPEKRQHFLFRPQYELLVDEDGTLLADVVGRYEHLERGVAAVLARLGLPAAAIPVRNAAPRPFELEAYYDDELREAVAAHYAEDFRRFGYPPTLPGATP